MKEILSIKELTISFKMGNQNLKVVDRVFLSLGVGECVAIVGESGSGKSTLGKAIIGLNPEETTCVESGTIFYKGQNLATLKSYRGKEIGIIFQDTLSSLNPTMRVGKQVLESLRKHNPKLSKEAGYKKVIELFHWTGIFDPEKRFYQYPHELSGGIRQRIVIAIALAAEPKILIADEPTSALDAATQGQILDLLKKIQKDLSMSIIFITHDLGIVSGFATKTLVMYAGSILEEAPTDVLLNTPKHPYTQKLLQSIPRLNLKKTDALIPIIGSPPSLLHPVSGCPFHPRCEFASSICREQKPVKKIACWLYD